MCLLHKNQSSGTTLNELGQKKSENILRKLAQLANDDSVSKADGLWKLAYPEPAWSMHADLCKVRKITAGRHRVYFRGRHSECNYYIFLVMLNKKSEVDQPKCEQFRKRILKAMTDTAYVPVPHVVMED